MYFDIDYMTMYCMCGIGMCCLSVLINAHTTEKSLLVQTRSSVCMLFTHVGEYVTHTLVFVNDVCSIKQLLVTCHHLCALSTPSTHSSTPHPISH